MSKQEDLIIGRVYVGKWGALLSLAMLVSCVAPGQAAERWTIPAGGEPRTVREADGALRRAEFFGEQRKRPLVERGDPLGIPLVDTADAEAWQAGLPAEDSLVLKRFIRHQGTGPEAVYPNAWFSFLFPLDQLETEEDYPAEIRLGHDGTYLYLTGILQMPTGKHPGAEPQVYGAWPAPGADFDNTEFLVLSVDGGSQRRVPDRLFFIDSQGRVLYRHPTDWGGIRVLSVEDGAGSIETHVTQDYGVWRLVLRAPLALLLPDDFPRSRAFPLSVGRVTGDPAGGVPLRASSLAGTFLGRPVGLFPRFTLGRRADRLPQVTMAAYAFTADAALGRGHDLRGRQAAQAAVFSRKDGHRVRLRHDVKVDGLRILLHTREVVLEEGLNVLHWDWTLEEDWEAFTHYFEVNGDFEPFEFSSRAHAAPWLHLAPREYRAPEGGRLGVTLDLGGHPEVLADKTLRYRLRADRTGDLHGEGLLVSPEGSTVNLEFDLAAAGVPAGGTRLELALLDAGGSVLGAAEHAFEVYERPDHRGDDLHLPLLDVAEAQVQVPWPVRIGLPFPEGMLTETDRLRVVNSRDETVPAEFIPRARWHRDGTLRWIHADFIYDPDETYAVRYALPGAARPEGDAILRVVEEEETLLVDTGAAVFRFGRQGFDGFHGAALRKNGGKMPFPAGPGGYVVIDEAGIIYDSRATPGTTVIEEQTADRVTVRFDGRCVSADGTEVLRYIMRVTAHAGRSTLEVIPTILFTADTRRVRFRSIRLDTGLATEGVMAMADGALQRAAGDATGFRLLPPNLSPEKTLLQGDGENWEPAEGTTSGVFTLSGPERTLGLAGREFREKAPLEVSWRSGKGLTLYFWPELKDFKPLPPDRMSMRDFPKMPFAHQGPLLDFNVPPAYMDVVDAEAEPHVYSHKMPHGITMSSAMGMARTHEFALLFAGAAPEELEAQAATYQARPHLSAPGEWSAATRAFGAGLPMTARNLDAGGVIGDIEQLLYHNLRWEVRKLADNQGKWVWGVGHTLWQEDEGYWRPHRLFRLSHHGGSMGEWLLFARSADPEILAFARRFTEYLADVGTCHHSDTDWGSKHYYGKTVGGVHCYKGYVPWMSGMRVDYNWYANYFLTWYYLTGHPRAADAIRNMYRLALSMRYGRTGRLRSGSVKMGSFLSLHDYTGDGRLLRYIHTGLPFAREDLDIHTIARSTWEQSSALLHYITLTDHPEALQLLAEYSAIDIREPWLYSGKMSRPNLDVQAFAYERFRDPDLLRANLGRLQDWWINRFQRIDPEDPEYGFFNPYNAMWTFLRKKVPAFIWALDDAGEHVTPIPYPQRMTFRPQAEWSAIRSFDPGPGDLERGTLNIPLASTWAGVQAPLDVRVVDATGRVLLEETVSPLPHPGTVRLTVALDETDGPLVLEGRSQGKQAIPLSF